MSRVSAAIAALILVVATTPISLVGPAVLTAHPLHTSLAELVHEPATRTVRVSLRVFIDDFTTASVAHARWLASRQPPRVVPAGQSPYVTYALAALSINDAAGKRVVLASCGGRRSGDLMWLCFRGAAPRGLAGFTVSSRVLFDLYRDQINIVQTANGGRKASLLFTQGDGLKVIR